MTGWDRYHEGMERLRAVGAREVRPEAALHDAQGRLNRRAWSEVGKAGLFRVAVPTQLGGEGQGGEALVAALAGLTLGSGDVGFSVSALAHLVCIDLVVRHGTAEQHARWLPPLLSGEWVGAVANAEPGAGSDILALRARAVPVNDGYVLTARKRSITNIPEAQLALVSARVADQPREAGVTVFGVELPHPRAHRRSFEDLGGLRTSSTGDLLLHRARLGSASRLGAIGAGVELFRQTFALERLLSGAVFWAALRLCREEGLAHVEAREQFGQPIGRNQHVQERLIKMLVAEELQGALLTATASAYDASEAAGPLSVLKLHGLESAIEAAQGLVRLLGGRGLRRRNLAEKRVRDLLAMSIFGGTVELHKMVLFRELQRHRVAVSIEIRGPAPSGSPLEAELVAVVARALPGVQALAGRYFAHSAPDGLVLARQRGQLAGFRILVHREVHLAGRSVRAAGIGIAIDPSRQRQGIGRRLTQAALDHLRGERVELVLAFLLGDAAEPLLRSTGFRHLRAEVSYLDASGARVVESAPCFATALGEPGLLSEIESIGHLELGQGTW